MRPSDDMHLMGEAYIGGVAPAGSNVTSSVTSALSQPNTTADYQQLTPMQKNALGAILKAYNLPSQHLPKLEQLIDGYIKSVTSSAPVTQTSAM
jgi:hypothetical protein